MTKQDILRELETLPVDELREISSRAGKLAGQKEAAEIEERGLCSECKNEPVEIGTLCWICNHLQRMDKLYGRGLRV
jgi:hypothetical protein